MPIKTSEEEQNKNLENQHSQTSEEEQNKNPEKST